MKPSKLHLKLLNAIVLCVNASRPGMRVATPTYSEPFEAVLTSSHEGISARGPFRRHLTERRCPALFSFHPGERTQRVMAGGPLRR